MAVAVFCLTTCLMSARYSASDPDGAALIYIARALTSDGKGILAADESTGTIGKRLNKEGLDNSEVLQPAPMRPRAGHRGTCKQSCSALLQELRRQYRELYLTAAGLGKHISGVILYKETLQQSSSSGHAFVDCLRQQGVLPGIKVDEVTLLRTLLNACI